MWLPALVAATAAVLCGARLVWDLATTQRKARCKAAQEARDAAAFNAWRRFATWAGMTYAQEDVDRALRFASQMQHVAHALDSEVWTGGDPRKAIETARASLLHVMAMDASPYRAAQRVSAEPEPDPVLTGPSPEEKARLAEVLRQIASGGVAFASSVAALIERGSR